MVWPPVTGWLAYMAPCTAVVFEGCVIVCCPGSCFPDLCGVFIMRNDQRAKATPSGSPVAASLTNAPNSRKHVWLCHPSSMLMNTSWP